MLVASEGFLCTLTCNSAEKVFTKLGLGFRATQLMLAKWFKVNLLKNREAKNLKQFEGDAMSTDMVKIKVSGSLVHQPSRCHEIKVYY